MILFIGFHNSPLNLYTVKLWDVGLESAEDWKTQSDCSILTTNYKPRKGIPRSQS